MTSSAKPKPRLTPEQNEARQEARAVRREAARDARTIAELAVALFMVSQDLTPSECVHDARTFLEEAKRNIRESSMKKENE